MQMTNEEALSILEPTIKLYEKLSENGDDGFVKAFKLAVESLKEKSDTAEKTAEWIAQDTHNCHTDFRCSKCGYIRSFMHLYGKPTADYTYCPNCGCRMKEVE